MLQFTYKSSSLRPAADIVTYRRTLRCYSDAKADARITVQERVPFSGYLVACTYGVGGTAIFIPSAGYTDRRSGSRSRTLTTINTAALSLFLF